MVKKLGLGTKLPKTEVTSVRFDPKLKLAIDLAARKERRTFSSFIEWAVVTATKKLQLLDYGERKEDSDLLWDAYSVAYRIWDPDEPDTFCAFAFELPELLNHEEATIWKRIKTEEYFWKVKIIDGNPTIQKKTWENLQIDKVREQWDELLKIPKGEVANIPENKKPSS